MLVDTDARPLGVQDRPPRSKRVRDVHVIEAPSSVLDLRTDRAAKVEGVRNAVQVTDAGAAERPDQVDAGGRRLDEVVWMRLRHDFDPLAFEEWQKLLD